MTTRPSDRATTLTTPEALAVLDEAASVARNLYDRPDAAGFADRAAKRYTDARDHLAARIAELVAAASEAIRAKIEQDVQAAELLARVISAEAELTAAQTSRLISDSRASEWRRRLEEHIAPGALAYLRSEFMAQMEAQDG